MFWLHQLESRIRLKDLTQQSHLRNIPILRMPIHQQQFQQWKREISKQCRWSAYIYLFLPAYSTRVLIKIVLGEASGCNNENSIFLFLLEVFYMHNFLYRYTSTHLNISCLTRQNRPPWKLQNTTEPPVSDKLILCRKSSSFHWAEVIDLLHLATNDQ